MKGIRLLSWWRHFQRISIAFLSVIQYFPMPFVDLSRCTHFFPPYLSPF